MIDREDGDVRVAVAERAARAGAAVAREAFRRGLDVETKGAKTDVVTEADREAQRRIREVLRRSYPDDAFVGEENDARADVPAEGAAWIVDPIDGANNFTRESPTWGTAVAAVVDGDCVAAATVLPALGDAYVAGPEGATRNGTGIAVSDRTDPEAFTVAPTMWWELDRRDEFAAVCRGIVERFGDLRRIGCAQATLALVADGGLDGVATNVVAHPWDSVGGVHLVRRAGGVVTDVHGEPWTPGAEGLVASNGVAHDEVLAAAREPL